MYRCKEYFFTGCVKRLILLDFFAYEQSGFIKTDVKEKYLQYNTGGFLLFIMFIIRQYAEIL